MGAEKFINGKVDDAHHEGRRAEVRRLQETDVQLHEFYLDDFDPDEARQLVERDVQFPFIAETQRVSHDFYTEADILN